MKLPENYENWIEFAKECSRLQQRYPDAQTVKNCIGSEPDAELFAEEYNINAVKAKAFDEVMGLANEAKNEVKKLENSTGTDMAILTRFLILLAK